MENPAPRITGATLGTLPLDSVVRLRDDQRLARLTQRDLQLVMLPRVNVLVMADEGTIQAALPQLRPAFEEPISVWRAGDPLILPSPTRGGTLILHDAGELTRDDQHQLLDWLRHPGQHTRVVSTTTVPLFPRVKAGSFSDTLYYHLNTVHLDLTGPPDA
jgi:hypothetical protein